MKNLYGCLIVMSLLGASMGFASVDDRVSSDGINFIKHSENFEYRCEFNLGGLKKTAWIDLDFKDPEHKQTARVAAMLTLEEREIFYNMTGVSIVGTEMHVMKVVEPRSGKLNSYITIGDSFYEQGVLPIYIARIFEKADGSIHLENTVYTYDEYYHRSTLGVFTGECMRNEPY